MVPRVKEFAGRSLHNTPRAAPGHARTGHRVFAVVPCWPEWQLGFPVLERNGVPLVGEPPVGVDEANWQDRPAAALRPLSSF